MPMPTYGPIWPTATHPTVWLPPLGWLTDAHGDGSRGWVRLAAIYDAHELDGLPVNPYAAGMIDVPDTLSYAPIAVTDDGAAFCHRCVADPTLPLHPADRSNVDGWGIAAWSYDGDHDGPLTCDHCATVIVAGAEDGEMDA